MNLTGVATPESSETTAEPWWWLGLTPDERGAGEGAAPAWVRFIDAVLAALPGDAVPYIGDTDGIGGFAAIVEPFAAYAGDRLARHAPAGVDPDAVRTDFVTRLGRRLAGLAARTLVLELNVMRVTGGLTGDDPGARFRDFVRLVSGRAALATLLAEYPVLARLLAGECLHAAAATAEILDRYAADRPALVAELLGGVDPGPLRAVETGAGDRHDGGRSVAILRFDATRVVYKPRPLAVHRSFNEIVAWFNARWPGDSLRTVALVERDGYGWAGHVAPGPCADADGLARFYRRQGAHLALLYPLQGTDIHFENVIACGEEPVLIDVETLFHPLTAPPPPAGSDPAAAALDSSVFRTALLPRFRLGDDTALDVSGLGGDHGAALPTDSAAWEGAGTDLMRLVRRPGTLTGAGNRPTLAGPTGSAGETATGTAADPAAFVEAFVDGFTTGYAVIAGARDEVAALFQRCADQATRVVVRSTGVYTALLDESTHPDLMRDAAERDRVLRSLPGDDDLLRPLADDEVTALWAGDVPLFTARPGARDLWLGNRRTGAVLAESGLDAALRRVATMDEIDLDDQVWIIRAAMASRNAAPAHDVPAARAGRSTGPAPDPERVLAAARRIGDQIVAMAFRADERVNWLGLELVGDRFWNVAPLGAALGNGYCGTALFLAHLAEITGTGRYAEVARLALRPLPKLLGALAADPRNPGIVGSGAYAGLGGITHTLAVLAPRLDDPTLRAALDAAADLTVAAAGSEPEIGAGAGCAGGLVALLTAYATTGAEAAFTGASACADRLMAAKPWQTPGFFHGTAGVGWALLRFAEAGGGPAYRVAGMDALRAAAHAAPEPLSFCRGRTGIALAIADCPVAASDPELEGVMAAAVDAVTARGPLADHSLCHGELGALELLGRVGGVPADRAGSLLAALDRGDIRCATPAAVVSPGLLTGLAGIGHGLLRLGFAGQVPPVLPPRTHTNTAPNNPPMFAKGTP